MSNLHQRGDKGFGIALGATAAAVAGKILGEHGFRLEEQAPGRVRFTQDETFSGLLVPLYARMRLAATRLGFAQMNEALRKQRNAALDTATQHEARNTLQGELIASQQKLIAELQNRVKELEAAVAASSPETTK